MCCYAIANCRTAVACQEPTVARQWHVKITSEKVRAQSHQERATIARNVSKNFFFFFQRAVPVWHTTFSLMWFAAEPRHLNLSIVLFTKTILASGPLPCSVC